jgi:hypothetical protein
VVCFILFRRNVRSSPFVHVWSIDLPWMTLLHLPAHLGTPPTLESHENTNSTPSTCPSNYPRLGPPHRRLDAEMDTKTTTICKCCTVPVVLAHEDLVQARSLAHSLAISHTGESTSPSGLCGSTLRRPALFVRYRRGVVSRGASR